MKPEKNNGDTIKRDVEQNNKNKADNNPKYEQFIYIHIYVYVCTQVAYI